MSDIVWGVFSFNLIPTTAPLLRFCSAVAFVILLLTGNYLAWSQTTPFPPSVRRWMQFEQFQNDRIVYNGSNMAPIDVSAVTPYYLPESGHYFPLRSIWVPASVARSYQVPHSPQESSTSTHYRAVMTRRHAGRDYVRFLVHPQSEQLYHDLLAAQTPTSRQLGLFDDDPLEGTPTSSIRTLLVRRALHPDQPLFFVKLSLDATISGLNRTITGNEVVSSIGQYLYWQALAPIINSPLIAIPEVLSLIPAQSDGGGQIVRLIPPDVKAGRSTLIPLFSLHHRENAQGEMLLDQLARSHNLPPEQFVVRYIVRPFIQSWTRWALLANLTFEGHVQNLLLEVQPISNDFSDALRATGRLFIRDLDSLSINTIDPIFLPQANDILRSLPMRTNFATDYDQSPQQVFEAERTSVIFMTAYLSFLDTQLKLPLRKLRGNSDRFHGNLVRAFYTLLTGELEQVARMMRRKPRDPLSVGIDGVTNAALSEEFIFIPSPGALAAMPEAIPVVLSSIKHRINHPTRRSFTDLCSDTLTKR